MRFDTQLLFHPQLEALDGDHDRQRDGWPVRQSRSLTRCRLGPAFAGLARAGPSVRSYVRIILTMNSEKSWNRPRWLLVDESIKPTKTAFVGDLSWAIALIHSFSEKTMKTFVLVGLLSSLAAGSALAQTAAMDNGGIKMADHATATIHYVTVTPADIMSSKLVGQDVYNNQGEKLGNVADLVIDNGKTVTGIVLSVGGFLGMGEHYVLIDPSSMVLSDKNGLHGVVDTNKDNLKSAPSFNYSKKS